MFFFLRNHNLIDYKNQDNSGFVVLGLIIGSSGKTFQKIAYLIVEDHFLNLSLISSAISFSL